ncbi:carboxypeptidase A1 precursor [Cordyceps fumosorosea ARSEF 2679]|uniref:Carboxypeptidase M14A n=1 Tax=Cordyceps fumosorosea (strain ARSEF 2679) TaxID=1081104 RepID=A0A167MSD0_CORFA|nr:carboxypeptidase A1 precursor [Cordyceps fumosorosea ARSEF 2679]OAA54702.1 carboxypeptidase A1 precursor [Cordyceps fumosorosea ARSEF 2679]
MKFLAFLPFAAAAATVPQSVSYDGHKVFRVPVTDDGSFLRSVLEKLDVTTWQPPAKKGAFADIHVPPQSLKPFQEALEGHEVITMHENLGESIRSEQTYQVYAAGAAPNSTWFNSYHPYNDHVKWLNDMASTYPKNSKVVTSGNSLQGNPITGLHIFGSSGGGQKPAIVFHGTVHAREWIASMVIEYFINELVTKYGSDSQITSFVDKYDFYLFPIVNTSDRMWRKNRQTTAGSSCLGHDINRNWPYQWNVGGGASTNPCADDFRGASAGDAPETKSLSGFLQSVKNAQGLKLYIDYHSYSQLFMTPYGYSCNAVAPNNAVLQALARGTAGAMGNRYGTAFRYGPICSTIYKATGSSVDYVADVVKADHTFTAELRDTGRYGFVLPPEQIRPSGEEAFDGVAYLLTNMK